MGRPQSNRVGGLWILGQHHTTCQPLRCDFCHPRLATNLRRANWTSLIWRLLWSFQFKPTLTWQFISHCDIDFFKQLFHLSGWRRIPGTRPWRSFDSSSGRCVPSIFGCNMIWNFDSAKCRQTVWHCYTLIAWRPWPEAWNGTAQSQHCQCLKRMRPGLCPHFFVGVTVSSKLTDCQLVFFYLILFDMSYGLLTPLYLQFLLGWGGAGFEKYL